MQGSLRCAQSNGGAGAGRLVGLCAVRGKSWAHQQREAATCPRPQRQGSRAHEDHPEDLVGKEACEEEAI